MAAVAERCSGCEVVIGPEDTVFDGYCSECAELFCPSLFDDPENQKCDCCGELVPTAADLSDDSECSQCLEERSHRAELESDYRFITRP